MSGVGPGEIIVGTFLFLFGLCMLLVGGGCTLMWLYALAQAPGMGLLSLAMLLVSGGTAWAGFATIRAAGRMFRGE
jgi:hypothetical protein